MKPATALILRGAGLLIEMIGLVAFVLLRDDDRAVAGVELRSVAIAAIATGFALWLASQAGRPWRSGRMGRPIDPLDL